MRFSLLAAASALGRIIQVRDVGDGLPVSGPAQLVQPALLNSLASNLASQSDIQTVNWAGAIYTSPPANTSFTSIAGRIIVPTPVLPSPYIPNTKYTTAVWIGLDGLTYQSAILQAGIQVSITLSLTTFQIIYEYRAWTEWYPASPVFFNSTMLGISPGDILDISINTTSPSSGTATLSNLTKQKFVTQTLSAPSAGATLQGVNAEWIVEDPRNSSTTNLPFVDFAPITFINCTASTGNGRTVDSSGANAVQIYSLALAKTLTNVALPGTGMVVVSKLKV